MYVQPLYLRAEGGRIPELKRVIVAYQNQVVMRETLDASLAELFGGAAAPRRVPEPAIAADTVTRDPGLETLLAEARRRYDAAIQAQREIDWTRYGEEMRRLGEVLERMGQ